MGLSPLAGLPPLRGSPDGGADRRPFL